MIGVAKVAKPSGFDRTTKRPGAAWVAANPKAKRPKDLWSAHLRHLADGYGDRCGYAAMLDPTGGTIDHYRSWKNYPQLAYEWKNYRFASHILNASKKTADDSVLDPHEIGAGWFEIILPSLQMTMTDRVPAKHRAKAAYTLKRLKLRDGEKIIRWRQQFYERFRNGSLSLDALREFAPLIADAVEKQMATAKSATAAVKRTGRRKTRKAAG